MKSGVKMWRKIIIARNKHRKKHAAATILTKKQKRTNLGQFFTRLVSRHNK